MSKRKPSISAITGGMVHSSGVKPALPKAATWLPLEGSTPKTLTDRTGCKWPVGGSGADTLFCDEPIYESDPCWCGKHRLMGRVRAA